MSASNTRDCIRDLIGKKVIGVLFDALPTSRADLRSGNKTLVFDDGTGFTFSSHGTFWSENAEDISRAIAGVEWELQMNRRDIEDVLALAGALDV